MNTQKELFVISSGYPNKSGSSLKHTFVKGYVDEAKNYYKKVTVFLLLPYYPSFLKSKPNRLENYSYDNVDIIYNQYPYIPTWPFDKKRGKIAYSFLNKKAKKIIKEDTVIHANFSSPGGVFAHLLSKDLQKDYTLTVHENRDWLIKEINSNNKLLNEAWKNAKTLIRVNKKDNSLLSKFNGNVITIANGFNHRVFKVLDKNECKKQLKISLDKKVITNIGFYNERKNQKLIIEAIDLLPENLKTNLKCFIIGGGSLEKELKDLAKEKNLSEVIEIVGQVKHADLAYYLNASDIFCLSSNSEGNPTVMFEALGVGVPYVGTSVGGVPEIITSEEYGLLCELEDKKGLSDIINKGLNKNWNKQNIIEYSEQYSWENIFNQTKEHY